MKKFNPIYFLPAIVLTAILFYFGGAEAFVQPMVVINLAVLIAVGVMMQKGRALGAYLGIVFGAAWIISDFFTDPYLPSAILCVPLIIYYIYCAVALKTAPQNK